MALQMYIVQSWQSLAGCILAVVCQGWSLDAGCCVRLSQDERP